ncbi:MAG TPA: metal ABC transporter permease [Bacilli bacterium]|jgi:zinc transport system permease protein|nr:metal ABC transporter permease [Bacilli bacterium]HON64020.1 metal ABC transporter permease [Bacilli bacterium]HOR95453.1 metal ABC transporter permease [Bacilli bacterium]HPK57919.1 metal ABC transporter permease [Bacilli bacterium]HPN89978.1 metal ABC transporter permease [Bacilli bacterium]
MSNFFEQVRDIFIYMKEPLLVGILLSLCAAILGVVLVLKRYSMIGDGLSHVAFGSVAVALALGQTPIQFALPIVMVAAYILLRLGQNTKIKADAAIAILSSSALAIGYLAGSLSSGFTADINNYMFGSITTASKTDLYLILPLSAIIIICFILFYNRIFAVTFDESFAKATGMHTRFYNILLAIFTAIVVVIGMRIMGTLLISSLIIFPALSSMRVFNNFKKVIISSMFISIFSFLVAFFAFSQFSSAASIVIVNLLVFLLFTFVGVLIRRFGSRGI